MDQQRAAKHINQVLRKGAELRVNVGRACQASILRTIEAVTACLHSGGKVLLAGNGGSAADAQHIAGELVGRFRRDRSGFPAIALACDSSSLTAISNDFGFEEVFARQVEALGAEGDILIAISTSGRSPNVIEAVRRARWKRLTTIGMTGMAPSELSDLADIVIAIPSDDTPAIQECHMAIGHILCDVVERNLAASDSDRSSFERGVTFGSSHRSASASGTPPRPEPVSRPPRPFPHRTR